MNETPQAYPKIVVIGGGNGTSTLLKGLREYTPHLTALVAMADNGGSTGTLRRELDVLPPGDARLCLIALGNNSEVQDLFSYRFDKGGLAGHNFGNLFLSAAESMTGSFEQALEVAQKALNTTGQVLPSTTDKVELMLQDGDRTIVGEDAINEGSLEHPGSPKIWLEPAAHLSASGAEAIAQADLVVVAPGLLYCSLASALLVEGIKAALEQTSAKIVYACNLVNIPRHTPGFKVHNYVSEIERLVGAPVIDYVLYSTKLPAAEYLRNGETGVAFDVDAVKDAHYQAVGFPLVNENPVVADPSDKIAHTRASVRHDSHAVAQALMHIHQGTL
jgi:uncharacterized cofD-like protein